MKDYMKATIDKAERYVLLGLSSAAIFLALSLAEPKPGAVVKWELLGFPLSVEPPLALVVLYLVYVFSSVLADNMILHARDIARLSQGEKTESLFGHPSILTVSPIGSGMSTVVPGAIIAGGIFNIRGDYSLPPMMAWCLAGFAFILGIAVFSRTLMIMSLLEPKKAKGEDKPGKST